MNSTPNIEITKTSRRKWDIHLPDLNQPVPVSELKDAEPIARAVLGLSPTDPLNVKMRFPNGLNEQGQRHNQISEQISDLQTELKTVRTQLIRELKKSGWTRPHIQKILNLTDNEYTAVNRRKQRKKSDRTTQTDTTNPDTNRRAVAQPEGAGATPRPAATLHLRQRAAYAFRPRFRFGPHGV